MTEITIAIVYLLGIYGSLNGFVMGTYTLFVLLGIHMFFITATAALSRTGPDSIGTGFKSKIKKEEVVGNFLTQVFIVMSTYHLYQIGYVYFAGMVTITVTIAFFANILGGLSGNK